MNITGNLWLRPNTVSSGANLSQFVWGDGKIFNITEMDRTDPMDSLILLDSNTKKNYELNFNASRSWTGEICLYSVYKNVNLILIP